MKAFVYIRTKICAFLIGYINNEKCVVYSKKATALCIIFAILLMAIPVSALNYQWLFEPIDGGRAAANMPEPFSVETTAGYQLIAEDNFNDMKVAQTR